MLHPFVAETIKNILDEEYLFPDDIIEILRQDPVVWENYARFSEPYKRIRIAYIDSARVSPKEFNKRLENFIQKTKVNKLIKGFGGIEKYY
jgi:uncharacterized protein YdeI (YjbR/CyaY-like superfamily)